MKESNYNFYINDNEDNVHLIYNAFKNTLVNDDDCKVQNFIKHCNGNIKFEPEYITKEEYNVLVSSGIIVCDDVDEKKMTISNNKKRMEIMNKQNSTLYLVITPTLQCNFKCYYCFESLNTRKTNECISVKVQNDIIHFIVKSIVENHIKALDITWYGGEPLLKQDIIFSMQKKINEIGKFYKIKIDSSIVTNGILLTSKTCDLLHEHGISKIQVTIDGPEQIHNKRRFYPVDPINNYNIILENILNSNKNIQFYIRINIDRTNMDYIFQLIDDLIIREIWPNKKNISICTAHVESINKTYLSKKEFYVVQDRIRYYLMEKYIEIHQHLTGKAKLNFFYPKLGGKDSCGYGVSRNSWVISYNGDVFRCWESVGLKEHKVGTIEELLHDFGHSIFEKIKIDNQTFEQWGCFECKYFPICRSKCPWDFLKSKESRKCTEWKTSLEYRLLNQYKLFLKKPEIFNNVPFNVS